MATLDNGGRVCERRIMQALDWRPNQRLDVSLVQDAILMRPAPRGAGRVQSGRRASIPAPIRHWCLLSPGDRVLLVADLERDVLVVHSMTTLDRLVLAHHASVLGGDHA
ncbi:AbrB/MazE/SpoVT family DNA-binding domain-containing protein [Umezawaea sp. Da 62-37]|uniref:AbrB/MazE/SpoVT family DNA-binding domain-containing protein n=1 Tax=Umezawaea sp. Da 62-37 TaxID=3075927 RepID=UPI0028F74EFE|nr:AbrB/MazE/SpoVT family DNA-binding domain-containing protein [Umezawaea sp. Da 62-37]WNV84710.1 AbrB/MazE/SpoVT family DNA-binding domain-containing protein [Umezawaea sp. Da 62-37]